MNAIVFSFTRNGAKISLKLQKYLDSCGFATEIFTTRRYRDLAFPLCRLMVFIGATGIAIRSIAPYIRSKTKDPAVISIDEQGKFVIPLLSGHIGGANGLAMGIAAFLKAVPVITTATDVNDLFAVDEWAARHNMSIFNMEAAKTFASWQFPCERRYSLLLKRLCCVPVFFIWASGAAGVPPRITLKNWSYRNLKN